MEESELDVVKPEDNLEEEECEVESLPEGVREP